MTGIRWAKWAAAWDRLDSILIGILTLLSLLLSVHGIAARYVLPRYALDWTGEAVIYLITWAFLLAGARAIMGSDHVKADLVSHFLPSGLRRYVAVGQDFFSMIFCLTVMVGGVQVVQLSLRLAERSDSSLALPLWIYYLCLPFGLASLSFRYAVRVIASLQAIRTSRAER